jgi:hypothetical protein
VDTEYRVSDFCFRVSAVKENKLELSNVFIKFLKHGGFILLLVNIYFEMVISSLKAIPWRGVIDYSLQNII